MVILVLCYLVPWETGETFVTPLCTPGVFSPMQNHDFDTWFKNCLHAWFKHFLHSDTSRRAAASKQSTRISLDSSILEVALKQFTHIPNFSVKLFLSTFGQQ